MGKLILILGGARSGKSTYAENLAKEDGGSVLYVATAEAKDEEMDLRIEQHHVSRPADWELIEAPRNVAEALRKGRRAETIVLVDCITFLVSNYLIAAAGPEENPFDAPSADPFDETIEAEVIADVKALANYAQKEDVTMLVVSNEVGMGLVPPYELGRAYRDILGRANQTLARYADEVMLLVAGVPMKIK